jgi:antagonist of KipI
MNTLVVEHPGLQTSVQDIGRPGYGPVGVSPSGAADAVSLRLANLLVGNPAAAAALEMTLLGGSYIFPEGGVVALAGADFGPTLNGRRIQTGVPHAVMPDGKLSLGQTRSGARCYLAFAGGVRVAPVLGSASTHLLAGLGGFKGRALQKGDVLEIGAPAKRLPRRKLSAEARDAFQPRKILRVTEGPQFDWFLDAAQRALLQKAFRVTEEADRMGLRLEGHALTLRAPKEMISEGVSLGAVQVTPSGQAILLFVEQQTAGGYPKIANVIGADLFCIGQLRPRDAIRFERVTFAEARELWIEQQQLLNSEEFLFA